MISLKILENVSVLAASLVLGLTGANFYLRSQPAYGATLTPVNLEEIENWIPHTWQIYLRGGGVTTWEATVRPHPTIRNSAPGDPQGDLRWSASSGLPWELNIDGQDLTFTIGEQQLVGTEIDGQEKVLDDEVDEVFDGLALWASATTLENRVSAGTEAFVNVTEVNGIEVTDDFVSCSATASTLGIEQGCQTAYISDEDIVSLKGFAGFLWEDGIDPHLSNPQSHLQIFIEAFDQGIDSNPIESALVHNWSNLQNHPQTLTGNLFQGIDSNLIQSVPVSEPFSTLNFLILSGLGVIVRGKSQLTMKFRLEEANKL